MSDPPDPFAGTRMTLGEHLDELRTRLFRGVVAIVVCFVVAYAFVGEVEAVAVRPFRQAMDMLHGAWVEEANTLLADHPGEPRTKYFLSEDPADDRLTGEPRGLKSLKPAESFLFKLRICLYAALVIGAPVLLWQMWQFIAAGLYEEERKRILTYFPFSMTCFVLGILFGYFLMIPYAIYFLNADGAVVTGFPEISREYYLSFVSSLCLVFGALFQLPLVQTFLAGAGMVPPATMSHYRGHFIVGAFIVAALLTPPDPVTQLFLGIPLVLLYEAGIVSARLAVKRRAAAGAVVPGDGA